MTADVAFFVGLEGGVWEALRQGDAAADRAALAADFLGVYPTGFASADDHAGQLDHGPTVAEYEIASARVLAVADGHVMLSYLAVYQRVGQTSRESMYVSSLWSKIDGRWVNVFSQDTPADDTA